jgi:hypothetical protein
MDRLEPVPMTLQKIASPRQFCRVLLPILVALSLPPQARAAVESVLAQQGPPPDGMAGIQPPVTGIVTAASGEGLTLKTDAGEIYTVDLTANTRVMKDRRPIGAGDLKVGDAVAIMGKPEPGKNEVHAIMMIVMSAEQASQMASRQKEMQESLGKTFIMGLVTKIEETRITVMRPDRVEQAITVDDNTSFHKGGGPMPPGKGSESGADASSGEPLTLADIKVGSSISGQGSLKQGAFVASSLAAMDAPQGAQGPDAGIPPPPRQ